MKIPVGWFLILFALLWIFLLGNYHLYEHIISGNWNCDKNTCQNSIPSMCFYIALTIDYILLALLFLKFIKLDIWKTTIHLDKFDKK